MLAVNIDEFLIGKTILNALPVKYHLGLIGALKKLKEFVNQDTLVLVYNSLFQPHFDYCCEVWDELGKGLRERLQKLRSRALD